MADLLSLLFLCELPFEPLLRVYGDEGSTQQTDTCQPKVLMKVNALDLIELVRQQEDSAAGSGILKRTVGALAYSWLCSPFVLSISTGSADLYRNAITK